MIALVTDAVIGLAAIPVLNTAVNLALLRTPAPHGEGAGVAILIPARDEEGTIGACIDAALANRGVDLDVIVLDDHSSDATAAIAAARAKHDSRLRVAAAPLPPPGWTGKNHACHVLSTLTDRPFLLFVDADVRLAPDAARRLVPPDGIDLVSGVPRQVTHGLVETSVVPMINSLIFGYLPLWFMRRFRASEALAAACGQMMMARADAYRACGGHGAVATRIHDGLALARHFRRHGRTTDFIDGTRLAHCRMYDSPGGVWRGFGKNATEGMATPIALPIWTVLLLGGQILPWLLAIVILARHAPANTLDKTALAVPVALVVARVAQAIKCRDRPLAVLLHPLGVLMTLGIQGSALVRYFRGKPVSWRGRSYAPSIE